MEAVATVARATEGIAVSDVNQHGMPMGPASEGDAESNGPGASARIDARPTDRPAPAEVVVSELIGDRLCVSCGFNLAGQQVVREGHYRMLIVRCPECATVASLQEFPLLGKWAARWGTLLAALWLLVMLAFSAGTGGAIFGLSLATTHNACRRVSVEVERRFAAHVALQQGADPSVHAGSIDWYGPSWVDATWWGSQNGDEILRATGAGLDRFDYRAILMVALQWWLIGLMGLVWGVALLHARGVRLLLAGLVPLSLAMAFALIRLLALGESVATAGRPGAGVSSSDLAMWLAGRPVLVASVVLSLVPLWVGMMLGRPLARVMVRVLLPPRSRGALGVLWVTDGLKLPTSGAQRAKGV